MLNAEGIKGGFLEYKGRPLVRQDKDIYYGDLSENYHIHMMIMTERDLGDGEEIPDKIVVQLLRRDGNPEKQTLSSGLADALETAEAWLDRSNK